MKKLTRFTLFLAVSAGIYGCDTMNQNSNSNPSANDTVFELTIAHINDTHSSFDPVPSSFLMNDKKVFNEFGGHPRLLTKAQEYKKVARENNQSMLFLHGGDAWQGSAYFKLNEGRANADILSKFGLDAMALGNHEFDLSNAHLNEFLNTINFPVVAANIDTSADADLKDQKNLLPYVLFEFDGNNKTRLPTDAKVPADNTVVAVFGITLDDMANISVSTGDVTFFNMAESAQNTVNELQARGINKIIALTHIGTAKDIELAEKVNGIDVIVGGHSHTLLGDFIDLGLPMEGAYAQQVINPNQSSKTCIVQAGSYAQAVGLLSVSFSSSGEQLNCQGGNTLLSNDDFYSQANRIGIHRLNSDKTAAVKTYIDSNDKITITDEQQALRKHINEHYKTAVNKAYGKPVAYVPETLIHGRRPGDNSTNPQHGSTVAPLVGEGFYYWASQPEVVALTGLTPDFALLGAGGVRTNISQGKLREGHIRLELLPFSNALSIVPLKRNTIIELLESVINATLPEGAHAGKFPYSGHLRYTFSEQLAGVQGKITQLEYNTGSIEKPVWQPLQDDQVYNVVMSAYNASGNDSWTAMYDAQKTRSGRIDVAYVDNKLTAFPVSHIELNGKKFKTIYQSEPLNCKASHVRCDTDAQAVIDFISAERTPLRPFANPLVNFLRISENPAKNSEG
ncbi:bifunctional metallophosphatase/5'-nucleotidase [Thalassolituus sp. HI0120]|nr:bifunctional metallophosphatase/5'-nucleotidase [Thalassolituus sp. HI0120]